MKNKKHINKSKQAYENSMIMLAMTGCDREAICMQVPEYNKEEYDAAIDECFAMLQWAKDRNDREEIKFWSDFLQKTRKEKEEARRIYLASLTETNITYLEEATA